MESYKRIGHGYAPHGIEVGDIVQMEKVKNMPHDYAIYRNGKYLYTTPADLIGDVWEKMDSEEDKFRELLLDENI